MVEIRLHSRGGQRLAAWAEALALAALKDGLFSQTYLSFGLDRPGAPITAIARISASFIRERATNASTPDISVVLDPPVIKLVDVTSGLKPGGLIVLPADASSHLPADSKWRVVTVDTAGLSIDETRAALLGAAACLSGRITLAALQAAASELRLNAPDSALVRGYKKIAQVY